MCAVGPQTLERCFRLLALISSSLELGFLTHSPYQMQGYQGFIQDFFCQGGKPIIGNSVWSIQPLGGVWGHACSPRKFLKFWSSEVDFGASEGWQLNDFSLIICTCTTCLLATSVLINILNSNTKICKFLFFGGKLVFRRGGDPRAPPSK